MGWARYAALFIRYRVMGSNSHWALLICGFSCVDVPC